jgi:peptidyl-dipeptidase A
MIPPKASLLSAWFLRTSFLITPLVLMASLSGELRAAEGDATDLLDRGRAAASREDFSAATKFFDQAIALDDCPPVAHYWRARALFRTANVKQSVADFDAYVQAAPKVESSQWERGIAMYYAGQYQRGADQFKLYQTYHDNDVENSAWRFLCLAKAKDVATARENLLPIRNDRRIPMMKIYALYRGEAQPDEVLKVAAMGADPATIAGQQFYAQLYVGLYYEATGDVKSARPLLKLAAESHRKTMTVNRYMWSVADVHYRLLLAAEKKEAAEKKDNPPKGDAQEVKPPLEESTAWQRHTIDRSSKGADGVRLGDVNHDGRMDIVTGWEEGGRVRICVQPESDVTKPWPSVEIGKVKSPEDAVFVDLDNDGRLDVVSCCEGKTKSVFIHWAPSHLADSQNAQTQNDQTQNDQTQNDQTQNKETQSESVGWETAAIPVVEGAQAWMFALPLEVDRQFGTDVILGAKGAGAEVGWLQSPKNPRDLSTWRYFPLYQAGWIMSLRAIDMDGDGDQDVLLSDRKGKNRGIKWLENPGAQIMASAPATAWTEHLVGGIDQEVMFLTTTKLEPTSQIDIVCATRNQQLLVFQGKNDQWKSWSLPNPLETPNGKAVACGDMNGDGTIDIVHSCNNGGTRRQRGVVWLERLAGAPPTSVDAWVVHDISGPEGVKFDRIELLDLDRDGDLDVVTCEERDNLGVCWYENPSLPVPVTTAANGDQSASEFIAKYERTIKPLEIRTQLTWWDANTTGTDASFAAKVEAQNKLDAALGDREDYAELQRINDSQLTDPLLRRQIDLLFLMYQGKQVDQQILQRMTSKANAIEKQFNFFRADVNGRELTDSAVRKILSSSKDSAERKAAWEASKKVGAAVEQDLRELILLRNDAATSLGYRDFHQMSLALNEQSQAEVLQLFNELDQLTRQPFASMKQEIDTKLGEMYGIEIAALRPWHYHDPFFQSAPNVYETDLDAVFAETDIMRVCRDFYAGIGLPIDEVLKRSDLYEKPGKSPHAYCADIDREGDVRVLANVVPNEYWMTTMMHELGHAVYSSTNIPRSVPYVLRSDAHILTTEGVAMMFERLSGDASWLQAMQVPVNDPSGYNATARRMRRNKLLIFSRWCQVMFRFEMAMYKDPSQDLNGLWWDLVEEYQGLRRPSGRTAPDYASKVHVVSAPAYYHNYMMGELFACQLHAAIVRDVLQAKDPQSVSYHTDVRVGEFLQQKVFQPGRTLHWNEMTRRATGSKLSAAAFAAEFDAGF